MNKANKPNLPLWYFIYNVLASDPISLCIVTAINQN